MLCGKFDLVESNRGKVRDLVDADRVGTVDGLHVIPDADPNRRDTEALARLDLSGD